MLLLSNPAKCSNHLARTLSYDFVALDENGKGISGLKQFDTDTGEAVDLDGNVVVPSQWEIRVHARLKMPVENSVAAVKRMISDAGLPFHDRVVPRDESKLLCSFCAPSALRRASTELWKSDHRFSLVRSDYEQTIAIGLYKAERAMDRIDALLLPYLDRLNHPSSVVSTYMSCDGNKVGAKVGGHIDFRTSLSPEEMAKRFAELRYDREIKGVWSLNLFPYGFGVSQYCVLYSLNTTLPRWENFEPVLSGFCTLMGV